MIRCTLCPDTDPFRAPDDEVGRAMMRAHLVFTHAIEALR